MKFQTYDDLIKFLAGKDLPFLNFEITNDIQQTQPCLSGDCSATLAVQPVSGIMAPVVIETIDVTFNSFHDKPTFLFEKSDESVLVVEEFHHIPNTCSTTIIHLGDRELTIGVCERDDGCPIAKFDVIIEGKLYANKEFKVVSDSTIYKNKISIND